MNYVRCIPSQNNRLPVNWVVDILVRIILFQVLLPDIKERKLYEFFSVFNFITKLTENEHRSESESPVHSKWPWPKRILYSVLSYRCPCCFWRVFFHDKLQFCSCCVDMMHASRTRERNWSSTSFIKVKIGLRIFGLRLIKTHFRFVTFSIRFLDLVKLGKFKNQKKTSLKSQNKFPLFSVSLVISGNFFCLNFSALCNLRRFNFKLKYKNESKLFFMDRKSPSKLINFSLFWLKIYSTT